jgi:hypothetical protein
MQNKSRSRIQIPGQPTPGQPHRIATVTGTAEACEQVRQMIERIIVEQASGCVMAGTGGGGYYNQGGYGQGGYQHQQQPQEGGGDYSAEWAAYYAAQQVAQQEQQAPAPAPTPAPAPGPASDAYYEEFFRYWYYYGEQAARQYYGAWCPPVGTPNPYGENPVSCLYVLCLLIGCSTQRNADPTCPHSSPGWSHGASGQCSSPGSRSGTCPSACSGPRSFGGATGSGTFCSRCRSWPWTRNECSKGIQSAGMDDTTTELGSELVD